MDTLFVRILFGHLTGDYLLQSRMMALHKGRQGWSGVLWCTIHAAVYTASIALFLWTMQPLVLAAVFVSHWIPDRWSLGQKWLGLIHGRNFIQAYGGSDPYREINIAFSCLVYTVVDNTFHLMSLWLVGHFLLR